MATIRKCVFSLRTPRPEAKQLRVPAVNYWVVAWATSLNLLATPSFGLSPLPTPRTLRLHLGDLTSLIALGTGDGLYP